MEDRGITTLGLQEGRDCHPINSQIWQIMWFVFRLCLGFSYYAYLSGIVWDAQKTFLSFSSLTYTEYKKLTDCLLVVSFWKGRGVFVIPLGKSNLLFYTLIHRIFIVQSVEWKKADIQCRRTVPLATKVTSRNQPHLLLSSNVGMYCIIPFSKGYD